MGWKGVLTAVSGLVLSFVRSFVGVGSDISVAYSAIAAPLKTFMVLLLGPLGFVVGWVPADWVLSGLSWIFLTALIFLAVSAAKGVVGWIVAITLAVVIVVFVFGGAFAVPAFAFPQLGG
ncbi:MAG: hypothetical protein WCC94_02955 [Candidatus Bathyarchaeia archaeon]